MKSVNVCVLTGWAKDIKHTTTNSGAACVNWTLEYNIGRKDDFGVYSDEIHVRECVAFGAIAEAIYPQMYDGLQMSIQGDNYNVWTNNTEGKLIRRDKCRVFTVNFHGGLPRRSADEVPMPEVPEAVVLG